MVGKAKYIVRILLIGVSATFSRIVGQLLIPPGEQSVLSPSIFVMNGTLPLVFSVYGVLAYSVITALFLLVYNRLTGNKLVQGLEYGIACSLIWVAYLLEPLPHGVPLDRITYPLADAFSLLVMGALAGIMLGRKEAKNDSKEAVKSSLPAIAAITVLFIIGRLIQYYVVGIYSSFAEKPVETIAWCVVAGLAIACVLDWFNKQVQQSSRTANALMVGGVLFGLNLVLFNFFVPLVLDVGLPDLLIRTGVDIAAVTIGCLFFEKNLRLRTS
jgi:dolichyl-phosphate-mannose--protein O-mannosyl transferase